MYKEWGRRKECRVCVRWWGRRNVITDVGGDRQMEGWKCQEVGEKEWNDLCMYGGGGGIAA